MLAEIYNILSAHLTRLPETAKNKAFAASLLVEKSAMHAFGAAVLIGPRTALTVAHNFEGETKNSIRFHHRDSGLSLTPQDFVLHPAEDLAVVTFARNFQHAGIAIEMNAEPAAKTPVFLPRQFDPLRSYSMLRSQSFEQLKNTFYESVDRGVFIDREAIEKISGHLHGDIEQRCSTFHLLSDPGSSGAGIYTQDGKLLTLDLGAKDYTAFGCQIDDFRRIVSDLKL